MSKNRQQTMRGFVYGEDHDETEQILPISAIVLPSYQPRLFFDEHKLDKLAQNLKSQGIVNRLVVRRVSGSDKYELVAGGRRFRAAIKAGLTQVPVIIKRLSDEAALALAITENLHREDLSPLEETESLLKLIALKTQEEPSNIKTLLLKMYNESKRKTPDEQNVLFTEFGKTVESIFEEIATLTWQSFVTSRLPLLNLPPELLDALQNGRLSYTKANAIAKVKDAVARQELLECAISQNLSLTAIKQKVQALTPSKEDNLSPKDTIQSITTKINQAQIWKNPKKWQKLKILLENIEALIEQDDDEP